MGASWEQNVVDWAKDGDAPRYDEKTGMREDMLRWIKTVEERIEELQTVHGAIDVMDIDDILKRNDKDYGVLVVNKNKERL